MINLNSCLRLPLLISRYPQHIREIDVVFIIYVIVCFKYPMIFLCMVLSLLLNDVGIYHQKQFAISSTLAFLEVLSN